MNTQETPDGGEFRAQEMVGDADLLALFARRTPDPQRFAAGVAARLQERGTDARGIALPRAAGILPLDLGWLGASKLWWLATPALLLAGCVLAALGAARSIQGTLRTANMAASTADLRRGPAAAAQFVLFTTMALVCIGGLWSGSPLVQDAMLLTVGVSTGVLAVGVARCARVGGIDRATVATLAIAVLEALLVLSPQWSGSMPHGDSEWARALPWTLATGIVLLLPFVQPIARLLSALLLGVVLPLTAMLPTTRMPKVPDAFAQTLTIAVDADAAASWQTLAHVAVAAGELGGFVGLHPSVRPEIARAFAASSGGSMIVLSAAHHLGIVDGDQWRTAASQKSFAYQLRQLRTANTPLRPHSFEAFLLPMLRASGDLDPATRDRLAERLVAGWPTAETTFPLQELAEIVWWLDGIGRGDLVDARRVAIHTLLVAHQAKGERPFRGGFAPNPRELPLGSVDSTHQAVALLLRVGVPTELDLVALRRFLVDHGSELTAASPEVQLHRLATATDLARLERMTGPIDRAPLQVLVDERNLVAIAIVVLLCWWAVASARPQPFAVGALP